MKKAADTALTMSADYWRFIEELKARVVSARISAARAITHEAILLYWDIGQGIVEKQKLHGWGDSVSRHARIFFRQCLENAPVFFRVFRSFISGTTCSRNETSGYPFCGTSCC